MHEAYFSAYQITTCYDAIIHAKSVDKTKDTLSFQLSAPFLSAASHDLLVNMGHGGTRYSLITNGKPSGEFVSDEFGHLSIRLPRPSGRDEMVVKPAEE
jgi:hypothetical protein